MDKRKAEPVFSVAGMDAPKTLKGEALREWKRVVPELVSAGVLTVVDLTALEMYCQLVSHCRKEFKSGRPPTGNMLAQLRGLMSSFGLDPSSRTRLSVPAPKPKDPMEEFLRKGKDPK